MQPELARHPDTSRFGFVRDALAAVTQEPDAYTAITAEIEALNVVRCRRCVGCAECSGSGLPGGMLVDVEIAGGGGGPDDDLPQMMEAGGVPLPPACRASQRVIELERIIGYDLVPNDPDADAEISARMSRYVEAEIAARGGMDSIDHDELREICRDARERAATEVPICVGPAWERELERVAGVARQYLASRDVRRITVPYRVRSRIAPCRRARARRSRVVRAVAATSGAGDPDPEPEPRPRALRSSAGGAR